MKQTYGPDFKINNIKWKPLTGLGENFGSLILAVDINAEQNDKNKTLNVVVKLPPRAAYLLDLFDSPLTFKKELDFYNFVAPEFINLQREHGIPKEALSIIVPQYYGGRLGLHDPQLFDEQAAIVLKNLKSDNYTTRDRILGLDKMHMDFAISHLAKLHAITICLKLKKPELFENVILPTLDFSLSTEALTGVTDMVNKAYNDYKNLKEVESYLPRIEKTIAYECNMQNVIPEEPWATLVHNDFWVNNMLFKYNESGKPIDMKIVDFQLTVYDYGMNDLIFFLMSSARKEVLDDHLDDMIEHYYDSFIDSIRSFDVDTKLFPKNKFLELVNKCAPNKFGQCIMMVQVIQAARDKATEPTKTAKKNIFKGGIDDENYKQKLLHILSTFDRKGWLVN